MEAGLKGRWAGRGVWGLHLHTQNVTNVGRKKKTKASSAVTFVTLKSDGTMGSFSSESRPRGANAENGRSRLAAVI